MKTKLELTVAGKTTRVVVGVDESRNGALSRAAAKLGYHGGAFAQPNWEMDHLVTVTDRPDASGARHAYTGVAQEIGPR